MGIFKSSREEKRKREIDELFGNLEIAKSLFVAGMPTFKTSPYGDVSSIPEFRRPTLEHIQMDFKAREEIVLFLEDFLGKDWQEVTQIHNKTENQWRRWILDNLLRSLRKFVPMAVAGTEPKIASLLSQGMELDSNSRTFYIQRDISLSMDGVGNADRVRENHEVYKHAEYLLLKEIIQILVTNFSKQGPKWLNDSTWYYATLFSEYMQWSHLEGPFKNFQRKR